MTHLPDLALPPLALYVHIPWCVRKCPYCDFNSHEIRESIPEAEYVQALLADLEHDLNYVQARPIDSIFIGGGTPSLFAAESLDRLLSGLKSRLQFSDDIEITLEANPGTVEQQKFQEFFDLGINRLSIGVQSFNDDMLSRLGRIHDRHAAIKAAEAAHYAGFERFNLDLMFGLPEQNLKLAIKDLEYAASLQPDHISWYQLTLEPNTLFYQQPPSLPSDDHLWEIQQQGQDFLADKGYQQYEISAYSRQQACKHNMNYWRFGDYLGIGAGAHAKLSDPGLSLIQRLQRCRHPQDYLRDACTDKVISQRRILRRADLILEFMMNALRLNQGVSVDDFEHHTGLDVSVIREPLQAAIEQGLMLPVETHIQASSRGHQYLNDLLELFMEPG
jgi:oxygen-independent coproporphyrinogen-3 oxidase